MWIGTAESGQNIKVDEGEISSFKGKYDLFPGKAGFK
jgi:hypothetical protein